MTGTSITQDLFHCREKEAVQELEKENAALRQRLEALEKR